MSDVDTMPDSASEEDSVLRPSGDDEVRSLLRNVMRVERRKPRSVLPDVQRKIRERSRGKFFADGWGTGVSPASTYLVTSALMLAILVLVYLLLVPGGWGIG